MRIIVDASTSPDLVTHHAPACEVMENGTLLIFDNREATIIQAAYAPGVWAFFEMKGD